MKNYLVDVFNDTLDFIKTNASLSEASAKSIEKTVYIPGEHIPEKEKKQTFLSNVFVSKSKTFEAAIRLSKIHPECKIAVLNFASATNPGGGVLNGSSAQEECLCRASTLYPALSSERIFKLFYEPNRDSSSHNSLHTDDIIYSPDIIICKDDTSYDRFAEEDFVKVDVITCAAPNLRANPRNKFNPGESKKVNITEEELYKLHVNRARNILEAALKNDVSILVLGAFGCGAFKNNPIIVANAYHDVLEEYASKFVEIEFAIYSRSDYDTYNYDVFKRKFED